MAKKKQVSKRGVMLKLINDAHSRIDIMNKREHDTYKRVLSLSERVYIAEDELSAIKCRRNMTKRTLKMCGIGAILMLASYGLVAVVILSIS